MKINTKIWLILLCVHQMAFAAGEVDAIVGWLFMALHILGIIVLPISIIWVGFSVMRGKRFRDVAHIIFGAILVALASWTIPFVAK